MYGTAQLPKFRKDQFFASWEIDWSDRDSILDSQPKHPHLMEADLHPDHVRKVSNEIAQITPEQEQRYERENEGGNLVLSKFIDEMELRALGRFSWLIPTAEVPLTNLVSDFIV